MEKSFEKGLQQIGIPKKELKEHRKEISEQLEGEKIEVKGEKIKAKRAEIKAKKDIKNFIDECEYLGGPKVREKFLEKNSYWKKFWESGEIGKEKTNAEILWYHEPPSIQKFERAIATLSFEEALTETEKIVDRVDQINKERKVIGDREKLASIFFELKITPKRIDRFLESSLEKCIHPDTILESMNKQNASPEIRKKILERYKDKINFDSHPVFGKKSIFQGFKDRAEREKKTVDELLRKKLDSILYRRTEHHGYLAIPNTSDAAEPSKISSVIEFIKKATENNIIISDYKQKIKEISEKFDYIPSHFTDRVTRDLKEELSKVEALIEKKVREKPEGIKGKGLEFSVSESGARRVYLDGELIGSPANASFSEKATNGKVVAWVVSEVIDRNTITGTQNRDNVYAWKKGWKEPKVIFEDHAWSSERYMRVLPPEVTPDGKVKIEEISGKETIRKEFKV